MKSYITWRGGAAAVLCCIGLVAALFALYRLRPREVLMTGGAPSTRAMIASAGLVALEDTGVGEMIERISASLDSRLTEKPLAGGQDLEADVRAILHAWLSGSADDYIEYLAAAGQKPPSASVWDDRERREAAWLDSTQALREASFDPGGVAVRAAYDHGVAAKDERIPFASGSRYDKLPGINSAYLSPEAIQAAGLSVQEVRIPVQLKELNGRPFNGLLGLSYGWDGAKSRWSLVAVTVYGVPTDPGSGGIRIPPF